MTLFIRDHHISSNLSHDKYDVTFHGDVIETIVTRTPCIVDDWISLTEILFLDPTRVGPPVIGLDVEWRPSFERNVENPVATIQLCVGRRCLIFQAIHAPFIPQSLAHFLLNDIYTFVGVGINNDVEKLVRHYHLGVAKAVDLCQLVANNWNRSELRNAGLKDLALQVLGKEVDKPRNVTLSRWDSQRLTREQVAYACVDAFVSFEIGRSLEAWRVGFFI